MKSYIFSFVLLASIFIGVKDVNAYFTTDQNVYRINDQTALFHIEYLFGNQESDLYLPVRATRDQAWNTENNHIGFEILKDGYKTNEGKAVGVVAAPIKYTADEYYMTPAGIALRMNLFVILTVEPSTTTSRYQLQVTDLPFYSGKDKEYLKLNKSELEHYKTPSLNLNRNLSN